MNYECLLTESKGFITTVSINRPESLNALNAQVLDELNHFFDHIPELCRVIVLTGTGEKSFVAGADIKELAILDEEGAYQAAKKGQDLFSKIENCKVPVIAAVNGFALGGGCELAMACHMRIASENARFAQPEINLGLMAGYGGSQRLPRLVGTAKATELLLTGDMISAEEGLEMGLVNRLYTLGELKTKVMEFAEKIASKPPLQATATLQAIQAYHDKNVNGYDVEAKLFASTVQTEDFREGTSAFVEKRKPEFKGR